METSTEIETKILNSFEQMIDNLTSEKDLDDKVNITNIQSAVDNILNEISGDPRNGFKKGNKLSEKGYNWPEIGDNWPEMATTGQKWQQLMDWETKHYQKVCSP